MILISPYLQIGDRFKPMLEDKDRLKLDIRIIYGKSELQPKENSWLKSLKSVRLSMCKNLHAKCYLNETEAIITSMNFYEFSQINNEEMGILVSKMDDQKLYDDICEEVHRLIRISTDDMPELDRSESARAFSLSSKDEFKSTAKTSIEGHCIRCATRIKLDVEHPYCLKDYQSWKKYSDKTYQEKNGVCHICGKPNKSSLEKPVCIDCYKQNRSLFKN